MYGTCFGTTGDIRDGAPERSFKYSVLKSFGRLLLPEPVIPEISEICEQDPLWGLFRFGTGVTFGVTNLGGK